MELSLKDNLKVLKKKLTLNKQQLAEILSSNSDEVQDNQRSEFLELLASKKPSLSKLDLENERLDQEVKKLKKDVGLKHLINEFDVIKEPELTSFYDESREFDFFDDDLLIKEEKELGPKNNYCQHFVDTGQRPQNFIRDPGLSERFEEYPKLRELIKLKDELIARTNVPERPMYIKSPLLNDNSSTDFSLMSLIGSEFDVILIEPPLHEYQITNNAYFDRFYSWDEIKAIDVASVASSRCFVFLWCGSSDGLDRGRECLRKWGFRRCEDICWIKTNKNQSNKTNKSILSGGVFQTTKEHCLMGIKGTVRRSTDSSFIHTNIDIDLIISEEPEEGSARKPDEIFNIIEHFCLGRRRLYLFGRDDSIRPGWLTVGPDLSTTHFDPVRFRSVFDLSPNGNLTGTSDRIEMLRPRSPPPKIQSSSSIQMKSPFNLIQTTTTTDLSSPLGYSLNNDLVTKDQFVDKNNSLQ